MFISTCEEPLTIPPGIEEILAYVICEEPDTTVLMFNWVLIPVAKFVVWFASTWTEPDITFDESNWVLTSLAKFVVEPAIIWDEPETTPPFKSAVIIPSVTLKSILLESVAPEIMFVGILLILP